MRKLIVLVVLMASIAGPASARVIDPAAGCPTLDIEVDRKVADELIRHRYSFGNHRTVVLPANLRWSEDPLRDRNWRFQLHTLRWTEHLWHAHQTTLDDRYLARYLFLLRDWLEDNPVRRPPSDFSWEDHAAAFRGMVYACALARISPPPSWLVRAGVKHGLMLARESFYVDHGNHALNQSIGLLELGCTLQQPAWRALATRRIDRLVRESVDAEGVSNEQSEWYQVYNFRRYRLANERLAACGQRLSDEVVRRIGLMPVFTAHAAQPSGRTTMIGDTPDSVVPLTPSKTGSVASMNTTGVSRSELSRVYKAGYAFFHSAPGARKAADGTSVGVRFGGPRRFHGHVDSAAVTLSSYGDRILLDPGGPHDTNRTKWFRYFASERAHNTVVVDGRKMYPTGGTALRARRHAPEFDFVALRHNKFRSVRIDRTVTYLRSFDALIVEDRVRSVAPETSRQLWHLHPSARPRWLGRSGGFVTAKTNGANVRALQLVTGKGRRIAKGETSPIQGWVTYGYKQRLRAPVVEISDRGRDSRFVTLFVPSEDGRRSLRVVRFRVLRDGYDVTLSDGVTTRRIRVSGTSFSLVAQ
ncbi:MAG TPA: heparinase II/III family protein [Actinomycetota bacterium]|nr:heparinase II/III family protein [Actinomycetota bacterium]